jgi:hypothetical protein
VRSVIAAIFCVPVGDLRDLAPGLVEVLLGPLGRLSASIPLSSPAYASKGSDSGMDSRAVDPPRNRCRPRKTPPWPTLAVYQSIESRAERLKWSSIASVTGMCRVLPVVVPEVRA